MDDRKKDKDQLMVELRQLRKMTAVQTAAYATAPIGLCGFDKNLRYSHINEWLAALNGLSVDEHLGKCITDVLPAVAAAGAELQLRSVLDSGIPVVRGHVQAETAFHPGEVRHYEHSYRANVVNGITQGVECVVEDITDVWEARNRSERLLQQHANVLDALPMSVVHLSTDLKTLYANSTAMLENVDAPLVGRPLERCAYQVPTDTMAQCRQVVADGQALHQEVLTNTPNGKRWFRTSVLPLFEDGVVTSILGLGSDITDVKSAQDSIAKVIELVPSAILMVDESIHIRMANAAATNLFGYPANELLGQPLEELLPATKRGGHNDKVRAYLRSPQTRLMAGGTVFSGLRKDGGSVALEIGLSSVGTPEGTAVLASFSDVSKREQTMKAMSRAMRLKDDFLASMSHELRTPLGSILGVTEALRAGVYGVLDKNKSEPLTTIDASAKHLLALVNEVLDLSECEAGEMKAQLSCVNVETVCSETVRLIRPQADAAKLQLSVPNIPAELSVMADARRLKQILLNLLSNAVKFTPPGGQVSLSVTQAADNLSLSFAVRDTGPGIPADQRSLLFQPFVQIDAGLNRSHRGSGLGLALSKRLAALHGGFISLESKVGEGSTFTLIIPLDASPAQEAPLDADLRTEPSRPGEETTSLTNAARRILIVDDMPTNIFHVRDYLQSRGWRVQTATGGQEALSKAHVGTPAVILMDIQMPGMDGLDVIRQLRARPRTRNTFIIAVTGLALQGDRQRCLDAGADDYFSKPYSLRGLAAALDKRANKV